MTKNNNKNPSLADETSTAGVYGGDIEDKKFYDELHIQAKEGINKLVRNRLYIAKRICGKEYWNLLNKSERIMAGRYISIMAENKSLPLTKEGKTWANALQYRLM